MTWMVKRQFIYRLDRLIGCNIQAASNVNTDTTDEHQSICDIGKLVLAGLFHSGHFDISQ